MPKQDNTTIVVVDVKETAAAVETAPPPAAESPIGSEIPAQPAAAGPSWQPPVEDRGKGRIGPFAWVLAVILATVAVGAYFVFSGQRGLMPPPVSVEEGATAEPERDLAVEAEPVVPPGQEEPAAVPEDETRPAVSAVEEAAPAITGTGEEFHDTLRGGSPGPTMVVIPAATFEMGSPGSSGNLDERPRHAVQVERFAIGKFEVTFAQYERFAAATGRNIPDNMSLDKGTHPVIFVSWDDAMEYTRWLSRQTGERYSLPSEGQWEYAAGAGARSSFWWGYEMEPKRAHCFGCENDLDPRKPTRIGTFEANPFGIHDTAGNVAEWVQDCWHDNYEGAPETGEVWQGGDCEMRVVRGGAYSSPPDSLRHANRDRFKADARYDNIGFRVMREVD